MRSIDEIVLRWPYPRLIAHRGAGLLAPENTLSALRLGHAQGYRMVEFDVQLAADGVAFLLHDATLERTTNGRGRADAWRWGDLACLDAGAWHSSFYAGEPLPSLASVARWAIAQGVACNIEIKPSPGHEQATGAAVALDAAALWGRAPVPPVLSSFSDVALAAARAAAPALPRALLVDAVPDDWQFRLERLSCVALDANHAALSAQQVAAVHAAGYRLLCYTANDLLRVRQLAAWGVDGIITDAVDRIAPQSFPAPAPLPF
jgi:glycerophosphoryl diester phosphodiesterase